MPLPAKHGLRQDRLFRLSPWSSKSGAFTLVEVVLALGVFSILIVGCIALLSLSSTGLRDVVTRDEAVHLTSAVRQHLNQLPFSTVYDLVKDPTKTASFYVCTYRAQPLGTLNSDFTPTSYSGTARNSGEAYVVVPTVRDAQDVLLKSNDLPSREGKIFRVKLSLSSTNPIPNATVTSLPGNSAAYGESVLTVKAQFFPLKGEDILSTDTQVPSQTCTLAVLR